VKRHVFWGVDLYCYLEDKHVEPYGACIGQKNRSLGTEMLSLNANEVALEKEKKLVDERQYIC